VFGLSFQKLIVLVVVIGGVIAAFRLISVLKRQQELARKEGQQRQPRRPAWGRRQKDQGQIEDMAACGRCGAYIAAEGGGCGRRDCPFRPR